jgi:DNA-directed RNA polymerase subunit RPC12/RpoP
MKKFILYLLRWQLSTPILWLVVRNIGAGIWATVVANLIGGAIFFWVDRFIFTSQAVEMWHLKEGTCDNCGSRGHLWRLVLAPNYDKREEEPKYFCMKCSKAKTEELRAKGIKVRGRSR